MSYCFSNLIENEKEMWTEWNALIIANKDRIEYLANRVPGFDLPRKNGLF